MPQYTLHIKIETDVEVIADSRDDAYEKAGQLEFGLFISRANATITSVTEDQPADLITEESAEGDETGQMTDNMLGQDALNNYNEPGNEPDS